MKKKKIFLGGYVNHLNAQNINCKSLSIHLNKDKYRVRTMLLGNEDFSKTTNVSYITVNTFFYSFSNLFAFLRSVFWADVCYFPKHQSTPKIALILASIIKTKTFTTIEGNMCNKSKKNMIENFGSVEKMTNYFSLFSKRFGITTDIIDNAKCGVDLNISPLFLGVEKKLFYNRSSRMALRNVIFIGSLIQRKKIDEFIKLSSLFPKINFNIVGDGPDKKRLKSIAGKNVKFYNSLNHDELSKLLKSMDLHFLPSISEGFPKVILETASSSIPSVVYHNYGAKEWIDHRVNGFVVSDFSQVVNVINELLECPELLQKISKRSLEIADRFNWSKVIKDWEKVIDDLR